MYNSPAFCSFTFEDSPMTQQFTQSSIDAQSVAQALAAPFEPADVKFKPQVVKGNRALAIPYLHARAIQDRLDEVVGVDGWQDEYATLSDGSVACRLQLRIGGVWITKMDVGGPSEQPDSGDRLKAAFSDALKRAAVKFGIGRYLFRVPSVWADYDPVKKQFVRLPELPLTSGPSREARHRPVPPTQSGHAMPANGVELIRRLRDYDDKLASERLCPKGALLGYISWTAPLFLQ
jgi:hypothetical protein